MRLASSSEADLEQEKAMTGKKQIDWSDIEAAAKEMAGNWRKFNCFAWHRGCKLEDAENWAIHYTSNRDSGLLEQSNEAEINKRLHPFSEGADPDLVFEQHSHWACGYLDGFSIRVYGPDGSITPAFGEFCRIKEALEDYPVLNEEDYSDREYEATLENYACEMWNVKDLPDGWESEVYTWFSDHSHDRYTENADDQGGWAPKEKILEALRALGYIQGEAEDTPIIVSRSAARP